MSESSDSIQYAKLLAIVDENCIDQKPVLKVNPVDDPDTFTLEELSELQQRDFRTRIFFSDLGIDGNNAWIRTHHTDVAQRSNIDYVREYFEAAYTDNNNIAAKSSLTGIMDMIFNMDPREYYNFATVVASGLSNEATHTSFQMNDALMKGYQDAGLASTMARRRLLLLMNIIFSNISAKRFLDGHVNIFRIVHCETKGQSNKISIGYVLFSFLLQVCLGAFVVGQVLLLRDKDPTPELRIGLYVLAALGSGFGFFSTLPEIFNLYTIYSVYGKKIGLIQMIDFTVNVVVPLFLVVAGFRMVTLQSDYINGVIMTTALLFIPKIDDALPDLLGYDQTAVIENFFIRESKLAYNKYLNIKETDIEKLFNTSDVEMQNRSGNCAFGVDFSEFFITNSVKEGSDTHDFAQPFEVMLNDGGHEIDPSNFITEDCLLKTVEWRYANEEATKPTVSYLRLTKMNGKMVEIDFNGASKVERASCHRLDGAFVITNFVMTSSSIDSLRVCGSENGQYFLTALEHYSLWEITSDAKHLLRRKSVGKVVRCNC